MPLDVIDPAIILHNQRQIILEMSSILKHVSSGRIVKDEEGAISLVVDLFNQLCMYGRPPISKRDMDDLRQWFERYEHYECCAIIKGWIDEIKIKKKREA